jgi:rubredoxin-NAD+ reductase
VKVAGDFKRYKCLNCGQIYDEAEGWPADGIAPGTRWADVPDDWLCPNCGSEKRDFDMSPLVPDLPQASR